MPLDTVNAFDDVRLCERDKEKLDVELKFTNVFVTSKEKVGECKCVSEPLAAIETDFVKLMFGFDKERPEEKVNEFDRVEEIFGCVNEAPTENVAVDDNVNELFGFDKERPSEKVGVLVNEEEMFGFVSETPHDFVADGVSTVLPEML